MVYTEAMRYQRRKEEVSDNAAFYDKAVFMDTPEMPEQENLETDTVPEGTVNMQGKKKILIPELLTMNKVLFDKFRRPMYSYLNCCLHQGIISALVGKEVITPKIKGEQCSLKSVTFWRINREEFYADVNVELKLKTMEDDVVWTGYLVCWCGFDEELYCSFEDLTDDVSEKNENLDLLSPFLIPYATNRRVDEISEEILSDFQQEALTNPRKRNAYELAKSMGLAIQYHPVYEHDGVKSIVFFKEDPLEIGEDRVEKKDGEKKHVKAAKGEPVIIPANTIVINTNVIKKDYSAFDVYHECYHYQEHYLFFRLQEMDNNDLRQVKNKEVIVDENDDQKDAIYFMEKQANRGGYGLMIPATQTRKRIFELRKAGNNYHHNGERYEAIGKKLRQELRLPDFRIRARMIQLGNVEAKGALNYVNRKPIRPFAFDPDSWREDQHTFVVEESVVRGLQRKNPDFNELIVSGKYVYADGHVVINSEKYVQETTDSYTGKKVLALTEEAEKGVDDCCLRFVRQYVQQRVGRYVYGRMYYDEDYRKQTEFFLHDLINGKQLDEVDAKYEFKQNFKKDFKEAVDYLKEKRKVSYAKMAEMMNTDDSTIQRWMLQPRFYRNEDFLTMICLILQLPDWISDLVFKRAGIQLDEDEKRSRALTHILRVQSNEGIQAANEYLKKNNLAPLNINWQ